MKRFICYLVGCHHLCGGCRRCDAAIYDWDYIQQGLLSGPISLWMRFKTCHLRRRCQACGRKFWPKGKPWRNCCSPECDEKFEDIPF